MRTPFKKLRVVINEKKWVAILTVLGYMGPPSFIAKLWDEPVVVLLSIPVTWLLMTLILWWVSFHLNVSVGAEQHISDIRDTVLTKSHLGSHPSITRVALLYARGFTSVEGADVKLPQYVEMLKESAMYEKLRDVTFLARVEPSDWGREEDGGVKGEAWRYLRCLAELKEKYPKIKMRRILVLEDEVYSAEERKTVDFDYFKAKHKEAKVDLIHMTPQQLVSARSTAKGQQSSSDWVEDLAVFVGEDYGHRGWILESNYDYKMEPSQETDVKVWMWCDEHNCMDHFPRLFEIIDNLYNHGAPGKFIFRVNEPWQSNAPNRDYLRKARILTGVPAS